MDNQAQRWLLVDRQDHQPSETAAKAKETSKLEIQPKHPEVMDANVSKLR